MIKSQKTKPTTSSSKKSNSFEARKRSITLIDRLDNLDERGRQIKNNFGRPKINRQKYQDNIAILLTRDGSIHIGPKKELLKIKLPGEKICTHLDKIHKIK